MFKRVEGFCNTYKDTCNRNYGCSQGHDKVMIVTDFFLKKDCFDCECFQL